MFTSRFWARSYFRTRLGPLYLDGGGEGDIGEEQLGHLPPPDQQRAQSPPREVSVGQFSPTEFLRSPQQLDLGVPGCSVSVHESDMGPHGPLPAFHLHGTQYKEQGSGREWETSDKPFTTGYPEENKNLPGT